MFDYDGRLAYSEILTDEKKKTAAGFWIRANEWFAARGITVERCHRTYADEWVYATA